MDEHLAQLSDRVAAAADAWFTDPQDTGVYSRLVDAIRARRHYLTPQLGEPDRDVDTSGPPLGDVQDDELLDELTTSSGMPAPLGQSLAGDPAETLRKLRAGS